MSYQQTYQLKSSRFLARLIGLFLVILLLGCSTSTIKDYPNTLPKNLAVGLSADSDSGVKTQLAVHRIDKNCRRAYLGSIRFGKKPVKVGIPNNKRTLLTFYFVNKDPRWYINSTGTISVQALVKPRPGYHYQAKPSYVDSSYEVKLYEISRRSGKRRAMRVVGLDACR